MLILKLLYKKYFFKKGFALIEILIALTILSIILLSVFSGISASINVMSGSKNFSKAMIIAKSKLNEFLLDKMRGTDLTDELIEEYPNFQYSRTTERFEHDLFGPLSAQRTTLTVSWEENGQRKEYSLTYIFPEN